MILIGLLFFLLLTAFFTSTEMALVASRASRIFYLSRRSRKYGFAKELYFHPEIFLPAVLVGTNLSIISFSLLFHRLVKEPFLSIVLSTVILLVFGETIPKSLTLRFPERVAVTNSRVLYFFYFLLYPIIFLTYGLSRIFLAIFRTSPDRERFSKREMVVALKEAELEGGLSPEALRMIEEMMEIVSRPVRDVMVPRVRIKAVEKDISLEELKEVVKKTGHTRFPVYDGSIDNVIGVVNILDILYGNGKSVLSYLKPVKFVPEDKTCEEVLLELKDDINRMAVVIDEYGGTAGIVTMEDIITEIVSEMAEHPRLLKKGEYIISGEFKVEDLEKLVEKELPGKGTVAGLIMEHTGRIPDEGETIEIGGIKFTVLDASEKRIKKVKVE